MAELYLGLDFSTQRLKALAVDDSLAIFHVSDGDSEFSVEFDSDLPECGTEGGVVEHSDGRTVTAPTLMWVKALDLLLQRMKEKGFPFDRVAALSGSGQQHGSVYWCEGAGLILEQLDHSQELVTQLKHSITVKQSPIWMDSSTQRECRNLEDLCGGPEEVTRVTGSRAYERFTGNQIAKLCSRSGNGLKDTERISLVSSFGACLFSGSYAPIDFSDGSGMNLLDIQSKDWWQSALEACCPHLRERLGNPVRSNTVVSDNISTYFVKRYGFSRDCKVVAFTGDNPSSLAGVRLLPGDVMVSLGTSDTVSMSIAEAVPQLIGHVFVNPVDENTFMAMLCYKNGSMTRERVRNETVGKCDGSRTDEELWEAFDKLLDSTPPGNSGHIGEVYKALGLYYDNPEIIPPVKEGDYQYGPTDQPMDSFPSDIQARAVVEGQMMAKYIHAETLGCRITPSSRILATGGASKNTKILQVLADVFNANVYTLEGTANAASLGAAYRAKHALLPAGTPFAEAVRSAPPYQLAVQPQPDLHYNVYQPMMKRLSKLLKSLPTFKE